MTTTDGLQKLETWIKSRDFALEVYKKVLPVLPSEEKYNLSSQLRRAATSIPANIAEG
jgi:four helix bundle protein